VLNALLQTHGLERSANQLRCCKLLPEFALVSDNSIPTGPSSFKFVNVAVKSEPYLTEEPHHFSSSTLMENPCSEAEEDPLAAADTPESKRNYRKYPLNLKV